MKSKYTLWGIFDQEKANKAREASAAEVNSAEEQLKKLKEEAGGSLKAWCICHKQPGKIMEPVGEQGKRSVKGSVQWDVKCYRDLVYRKYQT